MKITCVSDLHGSYPELPGGDLLIVAGDFTSWDSEKEFPIFYRWLSVQDYMRKIYIGGNHDNFVQKSLFPSRIKDSGDPLNNNPIYLCDSGTKFEVVKIWGSPWSKTFPGMNPHCKAFTKDTEEELAEKWSMIPEDVDILITHSPPYGILDSANARPLGSKSLLARYVHEGHKWPKLWVYGHIHEGYGQFHMGDTTFVNASHMDGGYRPVNEPITIEMEF